MQIIPFPTKTVRQKRLSKAIAKMEKSLRRQKVAVEQFRKSNLELGQEIYKLGENMNSFSNSLGRINVRPLRKNSLRLASMMADYRNI